MKQHAPATQRNRDPILSVLRRVLPEQGLVLEIAAGTGEHALYFAEQLPHLDWQPTDAGALDSIAAWQEGSGLANLHPPLQLDVTGARWPIEHADAAFCANMLHISPWTASEGLFAGASRILPAQAPLIIYGPFLRDEAVTASSNLDFNADLRARNPAWGIRHLNDVKCLAGETGFALEGVEEMPANNLTLVFRRLTD